MNEKRIQNHMEQLQLVFIKNSGHTQKKKSKPPKSIHQHLTPQPTQNHRNIQCYQLVSLAKYSVDLCWLHYL